MARLPLPGGDDGSWGTVLNDFLAISHTTTGELKSDVVSGSHIADDTITEANLDANVRVKLNANAGLTDHGALSGLSDDDHPQYLNNVRGDARYYTQRTLSLVS